jgi:hypothetical protein
MFALLADGVYVKAASAAVGAGPNCGFSFYKQKVRLECLLKIVVSFSYRFNFSNQGFVTNYHLLNQFQLEELGIIHVCL